MCNCDTKIREKIKDKIHPNATFVSNLNLELLSGRTFSNYEAQVPDKKKPIPIKMLHSFCPYCGEKYDTDNSAK